MAPCRVAARECGCNNQHCPGPAHKQYFVSLSRAIIVESGAGGGIDNKVIDHFSNISKCWHQLFTCCRDENSNFTPFRDSLASIELWSFKVRSLTSGRNHDIEDVAREMCENIDLQIQDIMTLRNLMGHNFDNFVLFSIDLR